MNKFTVIAFTNSTGQISCHHVLAEHGQNAFASAAAMRSDLNMVVALPGWLGDHEGMEFPGDTLVEGSWVLSDPEVFGKPAYQVTAEGIASVLEAFSLRVSDTKGQSFSEMASELVDEINIQKIVSAAMEADPSDANAIEQTGFNAVKAELVRIGVLES